MVYCKVVVISEKNIELQVPVGTSLEAIAQDFEKVHNESIMAAKVDNHIRELTYTVTHDCEVRFIDLSHYDGYRIYYRSLSFLLIKAMKECFPEKKLIVSNSISKGIYFEVTGGGDLQKEEVASIEKRMKELVEEDLPIVKEEMPIDEAKTLLESEGRLDRHGIVLFRDKPYVSMYRLEDIKDYFYGFMVPRTRYLKRFGLRYYHKGIILRFPLRSDPKRLPIFKEQKKLFQVFQEQKKWLEILKVSMVGDLNAIVQSGKVNDFIRVAEALQEKKIGQIADKITNHREYKKVVLISGPSSSGKTSFAHRLAIQLRVNGRRPVTLSLDDYFLNREDTPKDEFGKYDFESLAAVDVPYFNQQLASLIEGHEVEVPIFNFTTGRREDVGRKLQLDDDQILIIEGIHGLNQKLTELIPAKTKFKIYVSALTALNIDNHNRISTTDTRLIRRMVRDFQFRGSSAHNTIDVWPSVRRGEEKYIFPFQEEADVMFNSALNYELGALRSFAEELLSGVHASDVQYPEAKRLLEFIRLFPYIPTEDIPNNSIAREFLGGSCFFKS